MNDVGGTKNQFNPYVESRHAVHKSPATGYDSFFSSTIFQPFSYFSFNFVSLFLINIFFAIEMETFSTIFLF